MFPRYLTHFIWAPLQVHPDLFPNEKLVSQSSHIGQSITIINPMKYFILNKNMLSASVIWNPSVC